MIKYIADPGSNWNNIKELKQLATECKEIGIDYFKPQLYDATKLYVPKNNPHYGHQIKCQLSKQDIENIYLYCESIGLKCIFSPFDLERLQWVHDLGVDTVKVAARMSGDMDFLTHIKKYRLKPMISISPTHKHLSVFSYEDLFEKDNLHFLSCRSIYPADILDYSLEEIRILEGVSDHTNDINLAIASASIGAFLIEKHIYSKNIKVENSPDMSCSIEIQDFKRMIDICNKIKTIREKYI